MLYNPTLIPSSPQLPLDELGAAIEAMIAPHDAAAGDPDFELSGDELDGVISEDEPLFHDEHPMRGNGAGCE